MSMPFTTPFYEADMSKMFDMSKMTDMSKMFDMSKMTDMSKMFDMSKMADMSKMFDMSKMTDMSKMFDMSKMADMSKMFGDVHMPQLDVEAAFALQRKNMEAFTALNQAAYENMQALWHRQSDTFRQMVEEVTQTMQAMTSCPTPEDKALKQAEASKAAMDKYIATLRDTTETFAKCNNQALETVSARVNESLNEMYGMVRNVTDRAA